MSSSGARWSIFGLSLLAVACNPAPENGLTVHDQGERASAEQPRSPPTRVEEVRIARWTERGPAMVANMVGDLAIRNGCLVAGHIAKGRFFLPVFPYGEGTWDPVSRKLSWLGNQYALGDTIDLTGGNVEPSSWLLTEALSEIPDCGVAFPVVFIAYSGKHMDEEMKELDERLRAEHAKKEQAAAGRP